MPHSLLLAYIFFRTINYSYSIRIRNSRQTSENERSINTFPHNLVKRYQALFFQPFNDLHMRPFYMFENFNVFDLFLYPSATGNRSKYKIIKRT